MVSGRSPSGTTTAGTIAAIGERILLEGFQLAGVSLHPCEWESEFRRAWTELPKTTSVVILTPRCAQALGPALSDPGSPMTVVLPE